MFRKSVWAMGLAASLAATAPSQAAMMGGAADFAPSSFTQPVQFLFNPLNFLVGGRQYCWYDDGWRGPGWYWCGYGYRQGYGWGGGEGWHGFGQHRYERDWRGNGGRPQPHNGGGRPQPHNGGGHGGHDEHQH